MTRIDGLSQTAYVADDIRFDGGGHMYLSLWHLSATYLAEAIRSRQVSSQEVVEAHLRRIEAVNPSINAVPVILCEQAIEAAKARFRSPMASPLRSTKERADHTCKDAEQGFSRQA